ncbi:THO complex subunit 5 [Caenorhabditis elegans]|uniref:THO complex subunit 5 n=1 Tax=Caenorhabditis elegans TaxID=6239 RepID=H2L0N5_CAEEL|nr:THO complex subunit 5 [Caenorhabditis elegans]CCD73968.1 THO complex subunit 5 [Caenorhabditis elegans]|eukprot:NP_001254926.1 THO Complex (transcription factor/nuclear export) subunit [Caenorhabditis elegans]
MSVNVRPVKRFVEEQKKKNPEIKLSEKATQLLTDMPKMDSPEKLFNLEDKIATEMGSDRIFEEFLQDYAFLRNAVEEYLDGKPTSSDTISKIARLRRNTRLTHYGTALMRKEVAERMENVDAKLLQLQNVTSEVQHIQKEIDRCLDFSAGDEELELVPFEQFHTEASEILANETADNEHEQYLARLKFENEQRRELLSTLNELEGRRNVLQSDIRGKEVRLQGLKPKLEDLTKVAEPVFEMVGAKFKDLSIEGEQRKLSLQLPAPLAVAHIHAAAYKEIHDDKLFEFRILGTNDTEKQSKDETEAMKRKRKEDETTQEKINKMASELLEVHPMSLEFEIECSENIKISMQIQYLTELKVTTAKWHINTDSKLKKSPFFSIDSLMSDLFENDTGDKCPNDVGEMKIEHLKMNFNSSAKQIGKPFKFIQEISGSEGETDRIGATEHLRKVITTIRTRISNRAVLDGIIRDLESKKTDDLNLEPEVKINSFKICDDESFIASIPTSLTKKISNSAATDRFSYKIEASDGNGRKLTAYISIPADYPRHTALFGIAAPEDSESSTEVARQIEDRLNTEAHYVDDVKSIKEQLSLLLKHIDLS